ncbi:MAG: hypothetical protein WB626_04825 [Bacteroidota bacterium]
MSIPASIRRFRTPAAVLAGFLVACSSPAQEKDTPDAGIPPTLVMEVFRARFPGAEIRECTREIEDSVVVYDLEFTQEGRRLEADISEDGSILNWERAVQAKDLPRRVMKSLRKTYPKAVIRGVMALTEVRDGMEIPAGFEVLLDTAGVAEFEVTMAPDGRILEEGKDE